MAPQVAMQRPGKPGFIPPEVSQRLSELNDRTRMIEERLGQIRERLRSVDENLIGKFNELRESLTSFGIRISESEREIKDITESLQRMIRQLARSAKLTDVAVVEKAFDFFDPTSFLTEKDVINIVRRELGKGPAYVEG